MIYGSWMRDGDLRKGNKCQETYRNGEGESGLAHRWPHGSQPLQYSKTDVSN